MSPEGLNPVLLPRPGLTVLCGHAAATNQLLAALIEQWGAAGERIGLVDVRAALPRILSYATNQLGFYPETVWPLDDRMRLASLNGATLVALGRLHWRSLGPVSSLIQQGVPVVTTLAAPGMQRSIGQLRQWWTRPQRPLWRGRVRGPRVWLPPVPLQMVIVTQEGTITTIKQFGQPTDRSVERLV